jgi:ribose 5-phosphate isomerase B
VLVIGSRVIRPALARELVGTFLAAAFSGEERHQRRLRKVHALEHHAAKETVHSGSHQRMSGIR